MKQYITRVQAVALANQIPYTDSTTTFYVQLCNAAIQAYRDSLVDGVVLPVAQHNAWPNGFHDLYTADQLRQGIADALIAERQTAWDVVNQFIKPGDLGGNGCDNNAQRNGLILAANLLMERIAAAPDPKDTDAKT